MKKKNQILKDNLNDLMGKRKITSSQLCRELNLNKSTVHNYLNGILPKGVGSLVRIAHFFNLTLDELLFLESRQIVHRFQVDEETVLTITKTKRKE